jgi:branched-chain amino acid aminotransferase
MQIWFNGKLGDDQEQQASLASHALHYGTSAFEGIRFYEGDGQSYVFKLKEHLERMEFSIRSLHIEPPYDLATMTQAVIDTIKAEGHKSGYIRPFFYAGKSGLGLNPEKSKAQIDASVIVLPWGKYLEENVISVKISSIRRINPDANDPRAKVGGIYVNSIRANQEAVEAGFNEALLLDGAGNVAEGSGENIFMVKDGQLHTPALGNVLPGITRATIMELAGELNLSVTERAITPDELKTADELFFTGTAAEVTPIGKLDDVTIGDGKEGPVTAQLAKAYHDAVTGKVEAHNDWLTPIF